MSGLLQRIVCTLQLMFYALLPPAGGDAANGTAEVQRCEPRQIRGGTTRPLNSQGELRLFFPGCLAIAAPFVLFRLKREGFSRCSVQASSEGLQVRGWR